MLRYRLELSREHDQAMRNFFAGTHRRPRWRKAGRDEGFRIVHLQPGDVRRLNRRWGQVRIPKAAKGTISAPGRNVRQKAGRGTP